MKIIICLLVIAVWAKIESATVVQKTEEELFPLSIIHLNDFHAR